MLLYWQLVLGLRGRGDFSQGGGVSCNGDGMGWDVGIWG